MQVCGHLNIKNIFKKNKKEKSKETSGEFSLLYSEIIT